METQDELPAIDDAVVNLGMNLADAGNPNDTVAGGGEKRKSLEIKENPQKNPSKGRATSLDKSNEPQQPQQQRPSLPQAENVSYPGEEKQKSLTEPVPQPLVESLQKKEIRTCNTVNGIQGKLVALFGDGADQRRGEGKGKLLRPKLVFHNTYQLGPMTPFVSSDIEKCINLTLTEILTGRKYYSPETATLTATIAEIIRDRVLTFNYDRHKIIVLVTIGPMARQGIEIGFKCLWDTNRDSYAKATFQSYHIFASACVYGIYYE